MMADDNDIDRLILELHSTSSPLPAAGDVARLERWLRLLAGRGGSDLLLVAGAPASVRVDGRVQPLAEGPLDGIDIEEAVLPALPPHARRIYRDAHIVDASFKIQGVGRFRINLHRERSRGCEAASAAAGVPSRGASTARTRPPGLPEELAGVPPVTLKTSLVLS
jgi:hypothetical protein